MAYLIFASITLIRNSKILNHTTKRITHIKVVAKKTYKKHHYKMRTSTTQKNNLNIRKPILYKTPSPKVGTIPLPPPKQRYQNVQC